MEQTKLPTNSTKLGSWLRVIRRHRWPIVTILISISVISAGFWLWQKTQVTIPVSSPTDLSTLEQLQAENNRLRAELLAQDSGKVAGATTGNSTESPDGLININSASLAELEELPGIGPAKAQAIIDYREENGSFHNISELKKVSGIGEKTFDKFKDMITVGG